MIIEKPKKDIKMERLILGISISFLILSTATIIIAAKANIPVFVILAFALLGICFFFFTLLCKRKRILPTKQGEQRLLLLLSKFFLASSLLAIYGIFLATNIRELAITSYFLGISMIFFSYCFMYFCIRS